jgi:hypothetical protein
MSVNCDVILRWSATPGQLRAVGSALWLWCNRTAGNTGIYQHLDNQALADLIAGQLPASNEIPRQDDWRGAHFWVRDEASQNHQATIDSLHREIPAEGVEDIVVDGASWNLSKNMY